MPDPKNDKEKESGNKDDKRDISRFQGEYTLVDDPDESDYESDYESEKSDDSEDTDEE